MNNKTQNTENVAPRFHVCRLCEQSFKKKFDSFRELELHMKKFHSHRYKCEMCTEHPGYRKKSSLQSHMNKFHLHRYKCEICTHHRGYTRKFDLRVHYQNKHIEEYKRKVAEGYFIWNKSDLEKCGIQVF